ncbi:MAG: MFS transporter [Acidimicrobiia bacterium]|nr:MFS transporter [Acidimicrobiia bacterium]
MSGTPPRNDRRTIFGWAMYDWANSAYTTTTVAVLFPALLVDEIVPEEGYRLFGLLVDGEQLGSLLIGFGALMVFAVSPVLGAIADFSASNKRFMRAFAIFGAIFATSMYFIGSGDVVPAIVLFLLAQAGFVGSIVFYDGFLPDITTPDTIDRVSSKGFAFGYLGGGLNFLLVLLLLLFHEEAGLAEIDAARIGMGFAGLWWLGFGIYAIGHLHETGVAQALPARYARRPKPLAYLAVGFRRTVATTRRLRGFRDLLRFVVAFILYNDGVQTVIAIAPFYAKETLDLETETLALGILMVQAIAVAGAFGFGRIAERVGTRPAILWSISLWSVVLAWGFFVPAGQAMPFFVLAGLIGLVLGGTQALSRSLYGSMIPEEASAEFYGFFAVFEKFSAILGPFIFFAVDRITGSSRGAVLSLVVFFVAGGLLLARVDVDAARASRLRWAFHGDEAEVD